MIKINTEDYIAEKLVDMMEETPFQKIKVTNFVQFADISRSTFYMYFDSIYDVMQKIQDDFINNWVAEDELNLAALKRINKSWNAEKQLDFMFKRSIEHLKKNLRLYRILCSRNGDPSFQSRLINRSRRVFLKLIRESKNNFTPAQEKMLSYYWAGGQWNIIQCWANNSDEISEVDVVSFVKIALRFMSETVS